MSRLCEALHGAYPLLVPASLVWGFGRAVWDPAARAHGRRPLRIALLGPAGSGKSTLAEALAAR